MQALAFLDVVRHNYRQLKTVTRVTHTVSAKSKDVPQATQVASRGPGSHNQTERGKPVKFTSRAWAGAAIAASAALVLAGCAGDPAPTTDGGGTTSPGTSSSGESILIWADDLVVPAIQPVADAFTAATGVEVRFEIKEFGDIREEAITAIPTGAGPDIIAGAHDWTGQLVSAGVVAPIELGTVRDDFLDIAIAAFSYDGALYGMPFAIESIALVCNSELVPTAPATWDDVVAAGVQIALNPEAGDPYHFYPLQTSFGAPVFVQAEDGSYTNEIGMGSEGGYGFAEWLFTTGSGIFDVNAGYDIVNEKMQTGELACWITGPWAAPGIAEALGEDGYEIYSIPSIGGAPSQQFLGARGFFVSTQAKDPLLVQQLLVDYIGDAEAQTAIYEIGGRIPAHKAAFEAASSDKITAGFGNAGVNAVPMPSIPEMNSVWSFWGATQAALLQKQGDPKDLWGQMIADIQAAIGQ
jgi:arabinogalactan oligomer/maltooligosaccharide transport system substrate-binding protein